MVSVTEHPIHNYRDLELIRDRWEIVWAASSFSSPATTWEWVAGWWKHLRTVQTLRVLEISCGTQPVSFIPLAFTQENPLFPRRVRLAGSGLFDYGDFAVLPDYVEDCIEALIQFFVNQRTWDILDINQVPWQKEILHKLNTSFPANEYVSRILPDHETYRTGLGEDWEQYFSNFSNGWRRNVRRSMRLLEQRGCQFEIAHTEKDCLEAVRALFTFQALTTPESKPLDITLNPYFRWQAEIIPFLFKKNILSVFSVNIGGKPISVLYCFHNSTWMIGYQTSYDPQWSHLSPGSAVLYFALKYAISQGFQIFDFGRGEEAYKLHWNPMPTKTNHFTVITRTPASQVRQMNEKISRRVTHLLDSRSMSRRQRKIPV